MRLSSLSLFFLLAVLLSSPSAFGQPNGTDIVIGKRISLPSKVFNTEMPISIYLPAAYETSYELAMEKNPGKTDYEKRLLQNARDKLKELKQ